MGWLFYISKTLPKLFLPLGLVCLCLIVCICTFRKSPRIAEKAVISSILLIFIFGSSVTSGFLLEWLETRYPTNDLKVSVNADGVLLLTGGVSLDVLPRRRVELASAGDRVLITRELLIDRPNLSVVISGAQVNVPFNYQNESSATKQLLKSLGIDSNRIHIEEHSFNTLQSAKNARKLTNKLGMKEIVVVTSAFHMTRTMLLLKRQGLVVTPLKANHFIVNSESLSIKSFIPSAKALSGSSLALREIYGIIFYLLTGDILWKDLKDIL